ncbi:hypothetical protein OB905_13185 [Halobacteria archaeon AArc-dxtr1]|nr:hypothetical protein [Halobacteria archaeon AArc-dxtr1]
MLILRVIVVIVGLFTLVLMGLMVGLVVDPLFEEVIANDAVESMGMDQSLRVAMMIGMGMVLPLLGVAALIWLHTSGLKHDVGHRRY